MANKILLVVENDSTLVKQSIDEGVNWSTVYTGTSLVGGLSQSQADVSHSNTSLCYAKKIHVLVGTTGSAVSTDNGVTWTTQANGYYLNDIVWNGTYFIARGINMYRSINGLDWTQTTNNPTTGSYDITMASNEAGNIVVVSNNGTYLMHSRSSDNGNNWTNVTTAQSCIRNTNLLWTGTTSFAVAYSPSTTHVGIYYTVDSGANWTNSLVVAGTPSGSKSYFARNNTTGRYVITQTGNTTEYITGTSYASPSVNQFPYAGNWYKVTFNYNKFFAIDPVSDALIYSTTGLTGSWTLTSLGVDEPTAINSGPFGQLAAATVNHVTNAIRFTNVTFSSVVSAVGSSLVSKLSFLLAEATSTSTVLLERFVTMTKEKRSTSIASSLRATFWSRLWAFVHDGTRWVGVKRGSSTGVTSTDGATWTSRVLPANRRWCAIANNGTVKASIASGSTSAATTSDGITWTSRTLPTARQWTALTAGGSTFVGVALDSDKCVRSTDGITWTEYSMPSSGMWTSIAWNGTVFCAVGANGLCATSTDGMSWTTRTMPDAIQYNCVTWSLGQFTAVASGPTNKAAKSTNGTTWTRIYMPREANWTQVGPAIGDPDV
jgi:hypothetical protein